MYKVGEMQETDQVTVEQLVIQKCQNFIEFQSKKCFLVFLQQIDAEHENGLDAVCQDIVKYSENDFKRKSGT